MTDIRTYIISLLKRIAEAYPTQSRYFCIGPGILISKNNFGTPEHSSSLTTRASLAALIRGLVICTILNRPVVTLINGTIHCI